ncbi:MAG: XrtA system polysaccharide chain length determinant [Pseudomonadota bacterium]
MHEKINEIYGYLHGFWRYRWSSLLIAWIVGVVGWLVVYGLPDQYKARAAVHIDTSSIMKPLLKGLAVETDPNEQLMVMTRVMLSRENLLKVMRETDMDLEADTPEEKEVMVRELASDIGLGTGSSNNRSGSSIYTISYKSPSPQMAYNVVSTLLNTLIENTLNSSRTDTIMAQDFLGEQIAEYEKRLAASEKRMAEFKKKNVGFMPNEKGSYYSRLQRAEEEIAATKSKLRLAKQRHADLQQQLSGEAEVNVGISAESAVRLRNYQDKLDDLLMQFTNEHPDVQAMRTRIARLRASMAAGEEVTGSGSLDKTSVLYQEMKIQESNARLEVGKLQIMLAEQQRNLEELQQSIDIIPQVEADLAKLDRDYQLTKKRYLNLVERRESARLAQKVEQNSNEITFKVVDAPVVPLIPSSPDRPLLLAGVLVAALAAGAAWSVLMFLLFPTFVDFKQLRKAIDLPVLGAVRLQMTGEQISHRKTQLTSFLLAMSLLFGVFGGVLLLEKPGSAQVRALISEIGIYL